MNDAKTKKERKKESSREIKERKKERKKERSRELRERKKDY